MKNLVKDQISPLTNFSKKLKWMTVKKKSAKVRKRRDEAKTVKEKGTEVRRKSSKLSREAYASV